ncbi:MAG: 5-amino-6-(D-ribitylamino)uracil--L-tyrosine 4-hydroxyphenyl transferase CofH [Methanomicrobiales archaeon]|nr:5-amino-6-(D-ribitylamino)uracil--L-tyrosine 4-hydroxyphenyl transferase CofH [Methanomicrobiales archaeon]NYT21653.1 5-amino-6-(D-ribitylamino)uracil--L-tyrosine 4-hydroxyphenyl transferase CofH [Methanomicrobiales archaeon]
MTMMQLLDDVMEGYRLSEKEAVGLLHARDRSLFGIVAAADRIREARAGPVVTYVRNQNIHITNICKNLCGFCGFGRRAGDEGAFCDDRETVVKKVELALERRVTEICLLSGVHPDFTAETYIELVASVREAAPDVHIHAFSPDEVMHAACQSGMSTGEVLTHMKRAGLSSLQGTAAEILVDEVRRIICPRKIDTATWIGIIREAHRNGIPTTATIMYGTCERPEDRIRHLAILREIQDDTGGFTELVPLSYVHPNTLLFQRGLAGPGATGREDLLMIAVSRLFLDNFRNIQVSWGKLGVKLSQTALLSGANDLAGTMFSDDVSGDAGASGADFFDPVLMERICGDIGRPLRQRYTDYTLV